MLLIAYGTRPEWIKVKSVIDGCKRLSIPHKVLFTGQHTNFNLGDSDLKLEIQDGENRLDSIVSSILNNDFVFDGISHILIQGDTTTVLALSLAAFHRNIKIIHLEAGLRTYDLKNPYPEEANRQMVSRLADIHLCPTHNDAINLSNEKVSGTTHVVGNTVLDNLTDIEISYDNTVLITMHRRENHEILNEWFSEISKIALENLDLDFVIPLHPNPAVQQYKDLLDGVKIIDPLNHSEFIQRLSTCKFVISDSGGIQEEASFLKKKVIVCRKVTERLSSLGDTSFICKTPLDLKNLFIQTNETFQVDSNYICPYGDGHSSDKIIKLLKEKIQ